MRDFNDILDEVVGQQSRLLTEAFEAGRAAGRQEAAADMRYKIGMLLAAETGANTSLISQAESAPIEQAAASDDGTEESDAPKRRAPPGSVKPAIAEIVNSAPGLTAEEIKDRTGIKKNSVRGTLWLLSTEGAVERREGRWYPVAQTNEAAGAVSVEDTPTASITGAYEGASDEHLTGLQEPERQVEHEKIDNPIERREPLRYVPLPRG